MMMIKRVGVGREGTAAQGVVVATVRMQAVRVGRAVRAGSKGLTGNDGTYTAHVGVNA
jgi:hypothetical protein